MSLITEPASAEEIFRQIRQERDRLLTCDFGVSYLDDAILGMTPRTLTLVGARSGGGKTQFATQVVLEQQNFEKNKCRSVLYLALDHDDHEIEKRSTWQLILQQIKQTDDPHFRGRPFRFTSWLRGEYTEIFRDLEHDARTHLKALFAMSETQFVYKKNKLNAEEIASLIQHNNHNLFVVDHFHAIKGLEKFEDQRRAIAVIDEAAKVADRPVLILGQFRKSNPGARAKCPLPDMDDFAGNSQLIFIPHNVIVMAPRYVSEVSRWETYFQIVKAREAGDSKPFVAVHRFNMEESKYSERYDLYRFQPYDEPEPLINAQIPYWAKRATAAVNPQAESKPRQKNFSPYKED